MTAEQEAKTSEAPPSSAAPAAPIAPAAGGFFEWFWRGRALRKARAFRSALPPDERRALERALVAAELAGRALDPVDALRSGSATALALSLYREAAYWALRAQRTEYAERSLGSLFDSVPPELLHFAAGGAEGTTRLRRSLAEHDFVETAELPPELLAAEAQLAGKFVQALLQHKLGPERQVGELLLQRGVRCFVLVSLIVATAFGGWWKFSPIRRAPDLAEGKPWRASSSPDKCNPTQHRCAGAHTDMFFTTSEEVEPWLEIDLGKDTAFNAVEVTNRGDCCPDRAAPLVAEVSRDQKQWREVARRQDSFTFWETRFSTQTARYVRLRVTRRSIFHLDKVAIKYVP